MGRWLPSSSFPDCVHAERRDCIAYLCSSCKSQDSGTGQTRNSVKNEIIVILGMPFFQRRKLLSDHSDLTKKK